MNAETRCMIENCISLICWTIIAIVFETWWLVFFSFLFMNIVTGHYVICDKCGKHSPADKTFHVALKKAQKLGWIRRKVGNDWNDFCPDCWNNMERIK